MTEHSEFQGPPAGVAAHRGTPRKAVQLQSSLLGAGGGQTLEDLHHGLRLSLPVLLPPSLSFTSLSFNKPLALLIPSHCLLNRGPKLTQMPRATVVRACARARGVWGNQGSSLSPGVLKEDAGRLALWWTLRGTTPPKREADGKEERFSLRTQAHRLFPVRTSKITVPTGKLRPREGKD